MVVSARFGVPCCVSRRLSDDGPSGAIMPDNCFYRDASERLTFEMFGVPASEYPALCKAVVVASSLTPDHASFGAGLDSIFMDYRRGEQAVEMAWDIWSGFVVVAKSSASETLVHEIAGWLLRSAWSKAGERA